MFGVMPPWYATDGFAFNLYAISKEREDDLRRFGHALAESSTPHDIYTQRRLCKEYTGRDLDSLSEREIKFVEQVINQ